MQDKQYFFNEILRHKLSEQGIRQFLQCLKSVYGLLHSEQRLESLLTEFEHILHFFRVCSIIILYIYERCYDYM
jgi:hypothetical protein